MFFAIIFLQVWGLSLVSDQRLITGAVESELSVWDITFNSEVSKITNILQWEVK